MKKTIFVLSLAIVLVVACAGVAFAAEGDSGYAAPTAGVSPHGGYTDATELCAVCHAVHAPTAGGEKLLRSSVQDACIYCHVSANFAIKTVYAETATNYNGGNKTNAHDTSGFGGSFGCGSCHAVHGAGVASEDAYLEAKILKSPTGIFGYDSDDSSLVASVATSKTIDVTYATTDKLAVSGWCTRCHQYQAESYDGDSHVMGAATADYDGMGIAVATAASTTCRDCHQGGVTDVDFAAGVWTGQNAAGGDVVMTTAIGDFYQGANNWPHFTTGDRLLKDDIAVGNASKDQACLDCHSNTGSTF